MIDTVEEFLQVPVHHNPAAFGDVLPGRLDRLMGVPPRPEAVARLGEFRLKDRREHLMQRVLNPSIRKRWNAKCAYPALRLQSIDPAHRLGHVAPSQQFGLDRRPVLLEVVFELGDADAIDSGSAFVLDYPLIRKHQVAAFAHGLHQPAFPLQLRFRPRAGRLVSLGAAQSPLGVPRRFFFTGIRLPRIFCLHRLSVCSRRLLAAFNVRPFGSC